MDNINNQFFGSVSPRGAMGFKKLVLFALAGQLADAVTTWVGAEKYGCKESNPVFARMINRADSRYELLIGIKTAIVACPVIMHQASSGRGSREGFENILLMAGTIGFAAGIWNLNSIKKASEQLKAVPE